MTGPETHYVFFIPSEARFDPKAKALTRKAMPPVTAVRTDEQCTVPLQSPAPGRGCWKIECGRCPAWALISAEQSVLDPVTAVVPCGEWK